MQRALGVCLVLLFSTAVLGADISRVEHALEARTRQLRAQAPVVIAGAAIAARNLIAEFYERNDFRPVWRLSSARELQALVAAAGCHGLDPTDYHVQAVTRLLADAERVPSRAADREIVFMDALVRFAYHLRFGKANPRELHPEWNFARERIDPQDALTGLVSAPSLTAALAEYLPAMPAYRGLREALERHRALEAAGGWRSIGPGQLLKPGMRDARVPALRLRLERSGDGQFHSAAHTVYDDALAAALRRFQSRHGLAVDGILGPLTLSALNVSVARRIDQLRINLDRLRWVARDLPQDYLLVDIAGFVARLYLHEQLAWASRVVVGRPYRSTPVFRATLRSVVINPAWTVPPTILREDVLPSVFKDPQYLADNAMRVVDAAGVEVDPAGIDWERYRRGARFPYEIVQDPGRSNPLGELKFDLPNSHAVYLHDTPARGLFARPERAFSSGCIRLETAHELATLLLDDPKHWSPEALREAIDSGETRWVPLKRSVAVLLLYFTVEADEHGVTHFRPDVYQRDDQVLAALKAPFRFHPRARPVPRKLQPSGR